ncbi:hypothetical protein HOLleu_13698 [Holothuria leucospilota]|uniref:Reverse transcriptase n=1 Tax=Holothuria leucospilota TaxID=206669 RepID=A0A9Q1C7H5_HOLLE|nr:hypothetical protein HOLleu_13698 [Holothuria leucospilota]
MEWDLDHLSPRGFWEYLKFRIRSWSLDLSKVKSRRLRERERTLQKSIISLEAKYSLNPTPLLKQQILNEKQQLDNIYEGKIDGIIIRSRARWVESGERNTKYFLNLEKRNSEMKTIKILVDDNGREVYDPEEILSIERKFYEKLYASHRTVHLDTHFTDTLHVEGIDDDLKSSCEGMLTEEECWSAIQRRLRGRYLEVTVCH